MNFVLLIKYETLRTLLGKRSNNPTYSASILNTDHVFLVFRK